MMAKAQAPPAANGYVPPHQSVVEVARRVQDLQEQVANSRRLLFQDAEHSEKMLEELFTFIERERISLPADLEHVVTKSVEDVRTLQRGAGVASGKADPAPPGGSVSPAFERELDRAARTVLDALPPFSPPPPLPTKTLITAQLVLMGYDVADAEKALASGSTTLEAALRWLDMHKVDVVPFKPKPAMETMNLAPVMAAAPPARPAPPSATAPRAPAPAPAAPATGGPRLIAKPAARPMPPPAARAPTPAPKPMEPPKATETLPLTVGTTDVFNVVMMKRDTRSGHLGRHGDHDGRLALWRAKRRCFRIVVRMLDHRFCTSPVMTLSALKAVGNMLKVKDLHGAEFLRAGGFNFLLEHLHTHSKGSAPILREGLQLCFGLIGSRSAAPLLGVHPDVTSGNLLLAASTAVKAFPTDATLVEAGAACIWPIVAGRAEFQQMMLSSGLVPVLLRGLSMHQAAAALQFRCCGALLALALDNNDAQDQLAALQVREAIRRCLVENPGIGFGGQFESLKGWMKPSLSSSQQSEVVSSAVSTERSLAGPGAKRSTTTGTGVTTGTTSAAERPPSGSLAYNAVGEFAGLKEKLQGSATDVKMAVSTMGNLVEKGRANELIAEGYLSAVLKAMAAWQKDAQVQDVGCALLCALAWDPSAVAKMTTAHEVASGEVGSAVLTAMEVHPGSIGVQRHASMAVWKLAKLEPKLQDAFVREGAGELLCDTIEKHMNDNEVAASAVGALLACALGNTKTQQVLTGVGAQKLIKSVLNTHKDINFRGEFDALRPWLKISKSKSGGRSSSPPTSRSRGGGSGTSK